MNPLIKKTIFAKIALAVAAMFATANLAFSYASAQTASGQLTSQLGPGSRGADVTALQTFLATNPSIYPEGIVSGYYGSLTAAAVTNFQIEYGLPAVGRVGPLTLAKLNGLIGSGLGFDNSAPQMSAVQLSPSRTSATFAWTTGELARARVFYSTSPIATIETDQSFREPYVSGQVADSASFQQSQSVTLQNLQPGTTYYYMIESIDRSNNVTVWPFPAGTFVTSL